MITSNRDKAIKGAYWMGLTTVFNLVTKLLIIVLLSRLLTPYDFGAVAAVQIVISFAEIFWMMGVGPAIIQKKVIDKIDISTGNVLNIVFGLSIFCLIYIFSPYIGEFIGINDIGMLRILSLIFIIRSISGVSEALLQKEMNFKSIGLINIAALVAYGISATVLSIFDFGAWSLIYAQLLQVLLITALSIIIKPINISFVVNKESAKQLMYFGAGFTISRVFNTIANQGDYFVVNKTLGSTALGFYNRAYQLLMVPTNVIGTVLDKVLFPLLSKYQDNNDKLRYVYLNLSALIAIISLPITFIVLSVGSELVLMILGRNWDSVILPFQLLIVSLFFRMAYKMCDAMVYSVGAVYKRVWTQVIYAFTIIFGAFIGKEWGIIGVSISTTIAIFINYLIMNVLILRLINLKVTSLFKYTFPIMIISTLIGILSYLLSLLIFSFPSLLKIIIICLFVGSMQLVTYRYIIIKLLPKEFNDFVSILINSTINKVFRKK